jgi:RHS repeat-associated protein
MVSNEQLNNSVNLYTGQAAFTHGLVSRPGRNGLDLRFDIFYSSSGWNNAETWNPDAPTGVLGLGWLSPFDMIFADINGTGTRSDDDFFILANGNINRLVNTGTADNNARVFKTEAYSFWKILYYPAEEKWVITRENGDLYVYGDPGSGRNTVQWKVKWDNWYGSSSRTSGQRQTAAAWNLNRVTNRFNDAVTFYYANEQAGVGSRSGQEYTRASYLEKIVGVSGEQIEFVYHDKDPDEYQCPHTDPSPPNAYQDTFATRYLDSVSEKSHQGETLVTHKFHYSAFLGEGNLEKRLLTSIEEVYPNGKSLPQTSFSYYGQTPSDNVSAANIYNSAIGALYGAIKQVTLPGGGTVSYQYDEIQVGHSQRDISIAPPIVPGVNFSKPRFYFETGYVTASWYGDNNTLALQTYTWDGRWIPGEYKDIPLANAGAYDSIRVKTSDNLFAVYTGQRVYPFYRNLARAGEWIQPPSGYYSPDLAEEPVSLAVGSSFAALLGESGGRLYRYTWNGTAWVEEPVQTLDAGTGAIYSLTGKHNYLLAAGCPSLDNSTAIYLYHLDEIGTWRADTFTLQTGLNTVNKIDLYPGDTFAAARAITQKAGQQFVQYPVIWWNEDFSSINSENWDTVTVPTGVSPAEPVIRGSLAAVGQKMYRFDGGQWNYYNIAAITYPGQDEVESVSVGFDNVLRKIRTTGDTTYTYDLVGYDPNTNTWSVPGNMHQSGTDANLACTAAQTKDAGSNFVVLADKVFYQNPDRTWTEKFSIPGTLSAGDVKTLRLLQSKYLIYQVNTGQSDEKTMVYILKNGGVINAGSPIELPGEKITADSLPLSALVGLQAFVSYTGTYDSGDFALTLHRVVRKNVNGIQTGYPVKSVTANNGYADIITGFQFDAPTAAIDPAGYVCRFNLARVIPGSADLQQASNGCTEYYFFNGLTQDEMPVLPYCPSDPDHTNARDFYSIIGGQEYASLVYRDNSGGEPSVLSSFTSLWWVYSCALGQKGTGFYARIKKSLTLQDGVETIAQQEFSAETGLLTRDAADNYNSAGEQEQYTREFKYWWEVYDPDRTLNLLTPVVETVYKTKNVPQDRETITGITVTTWKDDWGHGKGEWAPHTFYRALNGSPQPFTGWNPGDPEPGDGWLKTGTVQSLTRHGLVLESKNVDERVNAAVYDKDDCFTVADVINGSVSAEEFSYLGFEPYERAGAWWYSDPQQTLWENVTASDFHTGTRSLKLKPDPGTETGPVGLFQPGEQHRRYVFGCWAKVEDGFDPAAGPTQWKITAYNAHDNTPAGNPITIDMSGAAGKWHYFREVIDLDEIRRANQLAPDTELYLTIAGYNRNASKYSLVDNLRFSPLDAVFSAAVYNPVDFRLTAVLDNNGQAVQTVYNGFNRPTASIGPLERVNTISTATYSRDLFDVDSFKPQFPNSSLELGTTSDSRYYDFHDGSPADWQFSEPGDWSVTNGELTYSGTGPQPLGSKATLTVVAYTNFAARVRVLRQGQSPPASVGMGNGSYFVQWQEPEEKWRLVELKTDNTLEEVAVFQGIGFREEWLYVIVDGFIMFYADGIQLFCYEYQYPEPLPPDYGKLTLCLDRPGSFDDLVLLHEPQLAVNFHDGFGTALQRIALAGREVSGVFQGDYSVSANGVFFDELGRTQYVRNLLTARTALAALPANTRADTGNNELLEGNTDTYLYDGSGNHLTREQYLQADEVDYTTRTYEPSPLSRISGIILPREKTEDPQLFTVNKQYTGSDSIDPTPGSEGNTGKKFFMEKTSRVQSKDTDGNLTIVEGIVVRDMTGKILKEHRGKTGGPYRQTGHIYDDFGNLITIRHPNYFDPPPHALPAAWVETREYTFNRLLKKRTAPDTGTTQYIYDKADRLRFKMDAQGAGQSTQRVVYFKYDRLDRTIETGYIQDSNYQWGTGGEALQQKADDPEFPVIDPAQSQNPDYAAGSWQKKYNYDFNETDPGAKYVIGRPWKVEINNNASQPDEEYYNYDAFGNIINRSCKVKEYDTQAAYTFSYEYNNQDRVKTVIYPPQQGQEPFKAGYYYDRLGRLASIGQDVDDHGVIDPDNPPKPPENHYAAYFYDFSGRLAREQLNNGIDPTVDHSVTRDYTYNSEGWLNRVDDGYFTQTLDYYTNGGNNHIKYYDGNIAAAGFSYKKSDKWTCPPAGYDYQFQYDPHSRLTAGINSLGDAWNITGTGSPYDANGNILNLRRGVTAKTYNYAADGQEQVDNRVLNITADVDAAMDFEGIDPSADHAGDWSWGSNNGGPCSTGIYTGDKHSGTQCLKIAGGSLGHYDFLAFQTYMEPKGSYTLECWVKTGSGFAQDTGDAGWFVGIYNASGKITEKNIGTVTEAGDWTQMNLTIDVDDLIRQLGLGETLNYITLELRNYKRAAGSGTGAYLLVDDIRVQGSVTSQNYLYNNNGDITQSPNKDIFKMDYDPVTGLAASIQSIDADGNKLVFAYGANGQRMLETYQNANGSAVYSQTLYLHGLNDYPLMEKVNVNGQEQTTYYIYGLNGLLAVNNGGKWQYPLKDHQGSPRVFMDEDGNVKSTFDYMPFGELFRMTGVDNPGYLYTGQEYDKQSGLYNYRARFYDTELRRFYQADPARQYASPYVYTGNNPVNRVDPSGYYDNSTLSSSNNSTLQDDFFLRQKVGFNMPLSILGIDFWNIGVRVIYAWKSRLLKSQYEGLLELRNNVEGGNQEQFLRSLGEGFQGRYDLKEWARRKMFGSRMALDVSSPNRNLAGENLELYWGDQGQRIPRFYRTDPGVNIGTGIVTLLDLAPVGYGIYSKATYYIDRYSKNERSWWSLVSELGWELVVNEMGSFLVCWAALSFANRGLARLQVSCGSWPALLVIMAGGVVKTAVVTAYSFGMNQLYYRIIDPLFDSEPGDSEPGKNATFT